MYIITFRFYKHEDIIKMTGEPVEELVERLKKHKSNKEELTFGGGATSPHPDDIFINATDLKEIEIDSKIYTI